MSRESNTKTPRPSLWRGGCSPALLVLAEGGDAAAQGVQGGVDVVGFFHSVPAFLVLAALRPRQVTQGQPEGNTGILTSLTGFVLP